MAKAIGRKRAQMLFKILGKDQWALEQLRILAVLRGI